MTRRRLGAQLPIDDQIDALDRRVRELHRAIEQLEAAWVGVETGHRPDGHPIGPEAALRALRASVVALQELKTSPVDGRRRR